MAAYHLNPKTCSTRPELLLAEWYCMPIIVLIGKKGRGRPWGVAVNYHSPVKLKILSESQGRGPGGEMWESREG